ncbi:hypothetical protein L345_09401 [Ophiophagus hannah]|uniref:Uncharacterized protein n=1 Tax=Ophiophagus hannah TaxID=8665 RepID=V8NTF3_OPHHA|nr:hypothetical protein L345_09401 [Ophiophagus hannah]
MLWIYILTYNRCQKDKNSAPDEASSEPPFSVCENTFPSMGDCSEPITYINDTCNVDFSCDCGMDGSGDGGE